MVITLLEINADAPSLTMWVPPRLRRVRPPSPLSVSEMAMDPRVGRGVLGAGDLANGVSWALALPVALTLALPRGEPLLFRDPRPKGVATALVIWLLLLIDKPDEPEVGLKDP